MHFSPEISGVLLVGSFLLLSLFGTAILFFLKRLIAHLDRLTETVQGFGEGLLRFDKQINEKVTEVRHEVALVRAGSVDTREDVKKLEATIVLHDRRIQHIEDAGCEAKRATCKG